MKIALLLIPFFCWASAICIFTPPQGWQPAQPKELSKHVQIGFVRKGSANFNPSIHLAEEKVDCGLDAYLKAVKQVHLSRPETKWRDLGRFETKAGTGRLTEIRNSSPHGEIVLLQAIFLQDKTAYLLTAASLKEDLPPIRKEILTTLSSLSVLPDLWSAIETSEVRSRISSFYEALGQSKDPGAEWKSLQQIIQKETSSLGGYWQFLALQEGHFKIYQKARP